LFTIPATDYASWCKGLQQAGYATDKKYATVLIYIIKKYKLSQYDQVDPLALVTGREKTEEKALENTDYNFLKEEQKASLKKELMQKKYHVANKGQTINDISRLYGMDVQLLCSNNGVSQKQVFNGGEILFLTKKKPFKYQLPVSQ
jgi:LysM repeat protein